MAPVATGNLSLPQIGELQGTAGGSVVLNTFYSIDELRFAAGAGSYTVTGTGTLSGLVVGIDNQSTSAQTIGVGLSFGTTMPTITNSGTLTISGNVTNGSGTFGLTVTNNGTLKISGAFANDNVNGAGFAGSGSNGEVSGVISGVGAVRVSGTGKWTFSGANTYSGATTVTGAKLAISADNNLGTAPTSVTAGALVLNGGTLEATSSFSLASNRGVRLDGTGGNLQTDSGVTLSYSGVIGGTGGLVKSGAGRLVLSGNNTYSGNTTVNDGRLQIATGGTHPSAGNVVVSALASGGNAAFDLGGTSQTIGSLTLAGATNSTNLVDLGPGGTLTINGSVRYDATNNPGSATISNGSAVQLGSASTVVNVDHSTNSNNADLVIMTPITGTGALTKEGAGVLVLVGNSTYSGTTTIGNGTLQIGNGGTSGAISGDIVDNGALIFDRSDTLSYNGVISGLGNVALTGGGTLTLTGNNTYAGATTIKNSTLSISSDANLGTAPATATSNGLTLASGVLHTTGNLTLAANRGVVLDPSGGGSLVVDTGTKLSYAGQITGAGSLTKLGAGTLELGGSDVSTGNTYLKEGVLQDSAANAFSSAGDLFVSSGASLNVTQDEKIGGLYNDAGLAGNISIAAGKTLTISQGGEFSGVIGGAGALNVDGSWSSVALTGNSTYTGGTTIGSSGVLYLGNGTIGVGSTTGSIVSGNIVNNGDLIFLHSDSITYGGISGMGAVKQEGSGTLTLNGTNSYSGGTYIESGTVTGALPTGGDIKMNGGTLTISNSQTIGALGDWYSGESAPGNVVIGSGATLTLSQHADAFSGLIYGNGALVVGNSSYETLTGSATHTGGTTIDSGAWLWIGAGGTTGSLTGSIINNGQLYIDRSDNYTQSGGITGSGMLIQYGNGTTTLAGTNSYSGTTLVDAGTLTDAATGSFSPNSRVSFSTSTSATLNVAHDETIRGLDGGYSGNSTVMLGAVTLTLNPTSYVNYGGVIAGAGSITLTGGGRQYLGGANTYAGNTLIQAGTLVVTNSAGSATGTGTIVISPGAVLQIGSYGPGGAVAGNITNNGSVLFTSTDSTVTYGGVISGNGTLNVGYSGGSTAGMLKLTGANSYTGPTIVGNSTLLVGATNAVPTTSRVRLKSGGTLGLGADQTLAILNADSGSALVLGGNTTLTLNPSTGVYTGNIMGNITGAGALRFAGATVSGVTLSGGNSYSGGTDIASGYLFVASNTALGTGAVTVESGASLLTDKTSSSDITLGNDVTLASGVTLGGSGGNGGTNGGNNLGLSGNVTVATGPSTLHLQNVLFLSGTLKAASGTADLTFDSTAGKFGNSVFLSPIDTSITSLTANGAGLIFGSSTAPRSGLVIKGTNGYVGIAAVTGTAPTAASVLSLIDPSFTGALGFDTPGDHTALAVFSDPVNLSTFGSRVTLGSVSGAVLTGTITPSSAGYLFGNGSGALIVDSTLTGNNNVTVSSVAGIAGNGLTTVLRGANDFTGTVSVSNSSLVLDSAGALPAGRAVTLGTNGYLGYTEAFTSAATFADFVKNQILPGSYTGSSIIGVDAHAYITDKVTTGTSSSSRTVSDTIDLSSLGPVSLGTMTRATLTGSIYAPAQGGANKTLSLVAVGDGQLTISSGLLAGNVGSLTIGSTSGNANGTVVLNGPNTYTGGTTLLSGNLVVDRGSSAYSNGPLGSGTLTVAAGANHPTLVAGTNGGWLNNAVALGTTLQVGVSPYDNTSSLLSGLTSSWLALYGVISDATGGAGSLDVHGNTELFSANTFSGGVTLRNGNLTLFNDAALGTGTLTLSPTQTTGWASASIYLGNLYGAPTSHTISNKLVYNGVSGGTVYLGSSGPVTLTGSLQLNSDLIFLPGQTTTFSGAITGNARFGVSNGWARTVLSGANTYSGGTYANYGALVFANAGAMPANPVYNAFTSDSGGYIGIAFVPTAGTLQSTFLDRFDHSRTYGAIGFDSASLSSPNTFADPIDLTGFSSSPRLGSATHAILSGTITPRYYTYYFGGGGGLLEVTSSLTDAASSPRSLNVESYSQPTVVRLAGSNTFTGGVQVYSSGLVFAPGSMPATGTFSGSDAFIGTEDPAHGTNPGGFISRFDSGATNLIVGFNTNVTGNISLEQFNATTDPRISLGTSTNATISSQLITLPTAQNAYRFAGYHGGHLTVDTVLTDASASVSRSVVIGGNNSIATWASSSDSDATISSVTLAGTNTYTGGTVLNAGQLYVANDSALGTGTITLGTGGSYVNTRLGLFASGGARALSNAIAMGNMSLDVGGPLDLTLSGTMSGNGMLTKVGTGTLTLSGANAMSNYIMIQGGSIVFASDTANGTGSIGFTDSGGASVTFAGNNTVTAIWGNATDTINLTAGKTLTFNLQYAQGFEGTIAGSTGGLIFTSSTVPTGSSAASISLMGASTFSGPIAVQGNVTLYAQNSSALGANTNPVTVSGGAGIAVSGGITVQNPITLSAGTLAGIGTYKVTSAANAFTIGSGVVLAPGFNHGTGALAFDGSLLTTSVLILGNGGTYQWDISDATNGGWDTVNVNGSVAITATSDLKFTFSLASLAGGYSGLAANFDPTKPYSWTVLSATKGITGYTGWSQFNIDRAGFMNLNTGVFTLNLNSTQTALTLDFNPVPEPSTYALILAGLGLTFLASRRRRRS